MGLIFGLKLGMILGALGGGGSVAGGPVGWDGGGRVELASAVEQKMSRAFGGLQKKCKDHSPKRGSEVAVDKGSEALHGKRCLLYTSPSPRDRQKSRMPSSA